MLNVEIDKNSGYCFGVEYAIQMAEEEMRLSGQSLYCLGDIVHNDMEVQRLHQQGLRIINREEFRKLQDCKVLIRAHGEPPETYEYAMKNNIELIDASCPVVLKLQHRVKNAFDRMEQQEGQIVIYGQEGHAEVIGLTGQTNGKAIIVMNEEDLDKIDFTKPVTLFSQTTKSTKGFYHIKDLIEKRLHAAQHNNDENLLNTHDSICRQVSNREPQLKKFAAEHDVIIFVSSKKSSNGKALYNTCKTVNNQSFFIVNEEELEPSWFDNINSAGICGATSTPTWLMEKVARAIETMHNNSVLSN